MAGRVPRMIGMPLGMRMPLMRRQDFGGWPNKAQWFGNTARDVESPRTADSLPMRTLGFDTKAEVPVGKFKGRTYEELIQKEQQYCQWLMKQGPLMDGGPLKEFSQFLISERDKGPSKPDQRKPSLGMDKAMQQGSSRPFMAPPPPQPPQRSRFQGASPQLVNDAPQSQMQSRPRPQQPVSAGFQPSSPSSSSASPENLGSCVVNFGKHRGKSFESLRRDDPSYCEWVIKAAPDSQNPHLSNFAKYLEALDANSKSAENSSSRAGARREPGIGRQSMDHQAGRSQAATIPRPADASTASAGAASPAQTGRGGAAQASSSSPSQAQQGADISKDGAGLLPVSTMEGLHVVKFGLHKDKTFKDVFDNEQDYCKWLVGYTLDTAGPESPNWHLVAYILARWRGPSVEGRT